jgi:hypothetical protein
VDGGGTVQTVRAVDRTSGRAYTEDTVSYRPECPKGESPPMPEPKSYTPTRNFRLSNEIMADLEWLAARWKDNKTGVLIRAINEARQREERKLGPAEKKSQKKSKKTG